MATPQGVFVRGLWGSLTDSPYFAGVWPKVHAEIDHCLRRKNQARPSVYYCYGEANRQLLAERGVEQLRCLAPETMVNWTNAPGPRFPTDGSHNQEPWGVNHWRHKLEICREAMKEHGTMVWLDWDCCPRRRVPDDFWQRMAEGPPLQIPLRQFRRTQCPWRKHVVPGAYDRAIPHGAFMYCRDLLLLDLAVGVYDDNPSWSDEAVFAWLFERKYGGWGPNEIARYLTDGYSPYCYATRKQIGKPTVKLFFTYSQ